MKSCGSKLLWVFPLVYLGGSDNIVHELLDKYRTTAVGGEVDSVCTSLMVCALTHSCLTVSLMLNFYHHLVAAVYIHPDADSKNSPPV